MEKELRYYGFSEKEVKIYLACLRLGEDTTNRISEMSNISRTTVYDILENLKKKGIAYSFINQKKTFYGVVEPNKLIELLHQKADLISSIIPTLSKLKKNIPENPKVEVYEGKTGLMIASQDMLKEKEILAYGNNGKFDSIFEMFQANFAQRRIDSEIILRGIIDQNIPVHMLQEKIKKYTSLRKNKSFESMSTTQFIYGDCVLSLIYGDEPIAIITRSKEYANSQKVIFEELWKNSN
mgnify:FL=1